MSDIPAGLQDYPLTDQQQRALRDLAAGRIQRYGVPGQWEAFLDQGAVVLKDEARGWTARVSIDLAEPARPAAIRRG